MNCVHPKKSKHRYVYTLFLGHPQAQHLSLLKSIFQKRNLGDPSINIGNNLFPALTIFSQPNGILKRVASNGFDLVYPAHRRPPTAPFPLNFSFYHHLLQTQFIASYNMTKKPCYPLFAYRYQSHFYLKHV